MTDEDAFDRLERELAHAEAERKRLSTVDELLNTGSIARKCDRAHVRSPGANQRFHCAPAGGATAWVPNRTGPPSWSGFRAPRREHAGQFEKMAQKCRRSV
jgi:hypothetical protein